MSQMMVPTSSSVVLPPTNVTVRPGVLSDVPFMDSLQKLHTRQVGWMPTAQFEGKIALGHVLVAEDLTGKPVGYCVGNDRYFKRDDVGIIYQMNVLPGRHRKLVGATLLKAQFERSAYGCKLYCCWCAQDIAANQFWEAMGFVALAFRTGSRTRGAKGTPRVHIFWQKRINQGDVVTPWWFPCKTDGGAIREDRIVLPIPTDTHWSDAKPPVLPGGEAEARALPSPRRAAVKKPKIVEVKRAVRSNGMSFDVPKPAEIVAEKLRWSKTEPKAAAREGEERPATARLRAGAARPLAGAGERDAVDRAREVRGESRDRGDGGGEGG